MKLYTQCKRSVSRGPVHCGAQGAVLWEQLQRKIPCKDHDQAKAIGGIVQKLAGSRDSIAVISVLLSAAQARCTSVVTPRRPWCAPWGVRQ